MSGNEAISLWVSFIVCFICSFVLGGLTIYTYTILKRKRESRGLGMNIKEFIILIARSKNKKRSIDVCNVSEVLRLTNDELGGELYRAIKG